MGGFWLTAPRMGGFVLAFVAAAFGLPTSLASAFQVWVSRWADRIRMSTPVAAVALNGRRCNGLNGRTTLGEVTFAHAYVTPAVVFALALFPQASRSFCETIPFTSSDSLSWLSSMMCRPNGSTSAGP